jgi:hypothetical protein
VDAPDPDRRNSPDNPPGGCGGRPGRWVRGLTLPQAEALLDWLDRCGRVGAEVAVQDDGFAVWCPACRRREAGRG